MSANAKRQDEVSRYEWITGALGAVIFVLLVAHFVRDALRTPTPADIQVRVDSLTRTGDHFAAHFSAINRGGTSAAEVRLEATLVAAGDSSTVGVTLPFIAGGSSQSGAFLFTRDPRLGDLRVKTQSYQSP